MNPEQFKPNTQSELQKFTGSALKKKQANKDKMSSVLTFTINSLAPNPRELKSMSPETIKSHGGSLSKTLGHDQMLKKKLPMAIKVPQKVSRIKNAPQLTNRSAH